MAAKRSVSHRFPFLSGILQFVKQNFIANTVNRVRPIC